MENKALELLRKIRPYIGSNNLGVTNSNAIYITPAQQLRNSADEMEAKERLLNEIDYYLSNETKSK